MPSQISQKKVAKNTLMLYIRMGVVMIVSLYASRIVLATLGVNDFGIYSVVGSIIVMFSFMNITLTVTIRRFLAFELGKGNVDNIDKLFNASIVSVLVTSIIMVLGLESLGLWFLNTELNIPLDRLDAANFVFQLTILTFFLNMNATPFSSVIVVYEKMSAYAYLGIVETLLKLGLVVLLPFLSGDKLKLYGILLLGVSLFVVVGNCLYCNLKVLRIKNLFHFEWDDVSSIFKFSAWSILGSIIYLVATQGLNMIFNIFYGVAINAALGVSHQAANAVKQFVDNFQTAFNPQLTKNFSAEGLSGNTFNFVCQTSRLTIILVSIIGVPVIANISSLLALWLVNVPDYAVAFSVVFILYTAIDGISGPLFMLVYAKGDVKIYQLFLSVIQLFSIFLIYILCRLGIDPVIALSMTILSAIILYFARLFILKRIMDFPIILFTNKVILPFFPLLFCFMGVLYLKSLLNVESIMDLVLSMVGVFLLTIILSCTIYTSKEERVYIVSFVKSIIK